MESPAVLRIVRRISADDAFIVALSEAAFIEYSPRAGSSALHGAARGITLVAHMGDRRMGFAVLERPAASLAYLAAIAVLEEARGRGVGRALMLEVERRARAAGASRLRLATADSNLAALDLFLRLGLRRAPDESFEYPRGQRAIVLEKTLT